MAQYSINEPNKQLQKESHSEVHVETVLEVHLYKTGPIFLFICSFLHHHNPDFEELYTIKKYRTSGRIYKG